MTSYTQVPGSLDLSGVIGDDWSMGLNFDIALTGYTWAAAVVDSSGTSVAAINVVIVDAANGLLTLTITDTLTDLLSEKNYRWYLKQTNAGSERIWLAGNFRWYKQQSGRFGNSSTGGTVTVTTSGATAAVSIASARGDTGATGLLWDTVSYTVGALTGDDQELPWERTITITLKSGATEITEDTVFFVTLLATDNSGFRHGSSVTIYPPGAVFEEYGPAPHYALYAVYYTHSTGGVAITAQAQPGDGTTFNLVLFKPNGGIEKIEVVLESPT